MNNIFLFLGIFYVIIINPPLAFALLTALFISIIMGSVLMFGNIDINMMEDFLLNKEPTKDMLSRINDILVFEFVLFMILTVTLYNIFS